MSLSQRIGLIVVFLLAATVFVLGIVVSLEGRTEAPLEPTGSASAPADTGADAPAKLPASADEPGTRRPTEPGVDGPGGTVRGPDGAPIAGAEVFAIATTPGASAALRAAAAWQASAAPDSDGVLGRTVSDAAGAFAVAVPRHLDAVQLVARGPAALSPTPQTATRAASGAWPTTELFLSAGADLHITAPAGGIVVRADTRAGAQSPSGTPIGERVATSSGRGATSVLGLPPGVPLEIEVRPDSAAPARVWEPPLGAEESRSVTIAGEPGGVFQGRVLDDAGAPLADAAVEVAWPALPGRRRPALHTATTDGDGRFRLERVPTDELVGRVRADGFPTLDFWAPPAGSARSNGGFELQMGAGALLAGRLVDRSGAPIAGARVTVRAEQGAYAVVVDASPREATSDLDGRFEVRGLEGRSFLVVAEAEREAGVSLRGVAREVDVGADLELELVPTAALAIRAFDRDGEPVAGLRVVAHLDDRPSSGQRPGQTLELDLTAADGHYRLDGLQPGAWRLELTPAELAPIADVAANVPGAQPLELVFEEPATVAGRVVDPQGRPIAGGRVSAWSTRPEGLSYRVRASEATLTDADGRFELRRLRPGRLHLSARHPDFARSTWRAFELGPGQRRTGIELSVRRGAAVDGRVLDADGAPQAGRIVVMHAVEIWDPVRLRTDEDGRFRVDRLVPGDWQVLVLGIDEDDPGAASVDQVRLAHVTLVDGERTEIEIGGVMDDAGRIWARAAWAPADEANWAYVRADGEGSLLSQVLARDGSFQVLTATSGTHLVSVVLGKAVERGCELFVTLDARPIQDESANTRPDALDEPTARVRGRIVDPDGAPVAGASVRLESVGHLVPGARVATRFCLAATDEDGRFEFAWVTDGSYRVSAGGLEYVEGGPPQARHAAATSGPFDVRAGEEPPPIELALGRPRAVSGVVVDASGRPLPRATIYARLSDGHQVHDLALVHADEEGRFTYGGLPRGVPLTLSATAPGAASGEASADIDGTVRLVAEPAARLVVEHDARRGARLSIRDESGREFAARGDIRSAARTGGLVWEDGRHVFDDLPIGRYTVELLARDGRRAVKYVQLVAGDERTVALRVLR